jgi:arsenate reductase
VLFVCVANAARSQMAEAFARRLGLDAQSAGTEPAKAIGPRAVQVMRERGIDMAGHQPKAIDWDGLGSFDLTITMGCGVAESCPTLRTDEDWGLDDPLSLDLEGVRRVRDEIERRVLDLRRRLGA